MMNQTIINQHEAFKKEIENIKKENGKFLEDLEWKLMLENRENVRIARLFGEDIEKFIKVSMKLLSEQLLSLPKIIEKSNQEPETLVDKKKKEKKEKQKKVIKDNGNVEIDNMDNNNQEGCSKNKKPSIYELYAEDIVIDDDENVQSMLKQYGLEETLDLMSILNINTSTLNEKTVKMIKQAYAENLDKKEDNLYR